MPSDVEIALHVIGIRLNWTVGGAGRIPSEQLFKGQWDMFGMIGYCSGCSDINDTMGHCSEEQLGALHSLSLQE